MGRALIPAILVALATLIWAKWPQSRPTAVALTPAGAPRVVLFRGDGSANCQAIHRIVDEAEARFGGRIGVTKVDWSQDHPLIQQYQVRFLPTVVFVDRAGRERKRIIGESAAVQTELRQMLAQAETLLHE